MTDRLTAETAPSTLRALLARAEAAEAVADQAVGRLEDLLAEGAALTAQRDAALAERDRLAEALGFYACECAAHGDDCDGQHDAMYCGWRAKAALAPIKKEPTDGE